MPVMSEGHEDQPRRTNLPWLDLLKGVAILWIFLNHAVEAVFGGPLFANPTVDWPPLADRLAQAAPLGLPGPGGALFEGVRYLGWLGDQGVQLFVIASGFGLAYGLARRGQDDVGDVGVFLRRRLLRLFPLWWGAHVAFIGLRLVSGQGTWPTEPAFWLSALGLRFLPSTYYYGSAAWWYVGLQLQLYLVFPLLWAIQRRRGATRMLLRAALIGFGARAVAMTFFTGYVDPWMRGAVVLGRLPEFALGMVLAGALVRDPASVDARLRAPSTLLASLAVYALGNALSFTEAGVVFSSFLTGAALLPIAYVVCTRLAAAGGAAGRALRAGVGWAGAHSYGVFLVHGAVVVILLKPGFSLTAFAVFGLVALGVTVAGTVLLERLVQAVQTGGGALYRSHGLAGALLRAGLGAAAALGVLAALVSGAELAVRTYNPQEVLGWGERPALMADPAVGWKLRPNQVTRLRWESYDYTVRANALGFPGPDPAPEKDPRGLRVMVLGDAFSSAEGVDTERSWPRLLQPRLTAALGRPVEVLDFAITGHGPEQYALVAETFAPAVRPDVVLVAFFANDFEDAVVPLADFHASIGFDKPPPDRGLNRFKPLHLKTWISGHLVAGLKARLTGTLTDHERFYAGVPWLERDANFYTDASRARTAARLQRVQAAAAAVGATCVVVVIPAPLQVCPPDAIRSLPGGYDASGLDLELPQRLLAPIVAGLGWPSLDLRAALREAPTCPYQPANLHFTGEGNEVVAAWLAAHWPTELRAQAPPR